MKSQNGNVLFLILIAVALFAALSYAVTQSTRSGGGNASKESAAVNYAALQTQIAGIRATISRMRVNGVDLRDINFYDPPNFNTLTAEELALNVFHPTGGGYSFPSVSQYALNYDFFFNYQIEGVGVTSGASDDTGNDILMAVSVTRDLCELINLKAGIPLPLGSASNDVVGNGSGNGYSLAQYEGGTGPSIGGVDLLASNGLPASYIGKPEACVIESVIPNTYTYYAVLVER